MTCTEVITVDLRLQFVQDALRQRAPRRALYRVWDQSKDRLSVPPPR